MHELWSASGWRNEDADQKAEADMTETRGRGRPAGFRMTDAHRSKIANSQILNMLIKHVEGKHEMNATQVSAGLGLLKKCLPDLTTTTLQGDEQGGAVRVKWLPSE
jgi:hypothetical protein